MEKETADSGSKLNKMRYWLVRGAVLAVMGGSLALLQACNEAKPPAQQNLKVVYVPVAMIAPDSLVLEKSVYIRTAPDAALFSCDHSGLYVMPALDTVRPWRTGPVLCKVFEAAAAYSNDAFAITRDGSRIVYAVSQAAGEIVVIDLRTMQEQAVVTRCLPLQNSPVWSPDGLRMAFAASCNHSREPWTHIANADGSNLLGVPANPPPRRELPTSWSPSADRLAVVLNSDGIDTIVVIDTTGKLRREIGRGRSGAWSPEGRWIAYIDAQWKGRSALVLGTPDGATKKVLYRETNDPSSRIRWRRPVWSIKADRVFFGRADGVWSVDTAGKELTRILMPPSSGGR